MTIRKAALIAAIGCAIGVVPEVCGFFLVVFSVEGSPHFALSTFGQFIPDVVLPVFFIFLYFEASGRIKPETRSVAAISAAVLTLAGALYVIWLMHDTATLSSNPRVNVEFSVPLLLVVQSIWLVTRLLWAAIFIGFAVNTLPESGSTIPNCAAVLAICYVAIISLNRYLRAHSRTLRPSVRSHAPWYTALYHAFDLLGWATVPVLLLFLIVVWWRWQAPLSVHQNVLG